MSEDERDVVCYFAIVQIDIKFRWLSRLQVSQNHKNINAMNPDTTGRHGLISFEVYSLTDEGFARSFRRFGYP